MKLNSIKPLLDHPGPLTTVCLDVSREDERGDREVRTRWEGLRRTLEAAGAPAATLEAMEEVVLSRTYVAGPHGRFVVASAGEILHDRLLATPPVRDEAFHDGLPALMPAVQAADEAVRFLLVAVDRSGADLTWGESGARIPAAAANGQVEGGHDVLHKPRAGDMGHRRMQARVEDSWERNAEAVAAEIDRLVAQSPPEVVLLTGDVRAVALVRDALGRAARQLVTEVPGGSRAEGVKRDVFDLNVRTALAAVRARRREQVADRLRQDLGRGAGAVTDLSDVVQVLRRGQVEELVVLLDDAGAPAALHERMVWVGADPLRIGMTRDEVVALGDHDPRRLRADIALLCAALAQDAGVTFAVDGSVDLVDGVGAVLRWSDAATPGEAALAYTADTGRLR